MSRTICPPGGLCINESGTNIPKKFIFTKEHYFKQRLTQYQAKETHCCPDFVVKEVGQQLLQPNYCTISDVKKVLKDLHMYRHYDQASYIWSRLTGQQLPELTPSQTDECVALFRAIKPHNISQFAEVLVEQKSAEQN